MPYGLLARAKALARGIRGSGRAVHRKLHVFEHPNICAGNCYTVFDTPHGCRVGVLICYDNNIVENARATALLGAEILLAPHQTGGCNSVSPRGMKPIDPAVWARRHEDPTACEAELRGPKGRAWLMRWLPSRAHDNGMFLLLSNGIGPDDDEIRTGNAMVLDPHGDIIAESPSQLAFSATAGRRGCARSQSRCSRRRRGDR